MTHHPLITLALTLACAAAHAPAHAETEPPPFTPPDTWQRLAEAHDQNRIEMAGVRDGCIAWLETFVDPASHRFRALRYHAAAYRRALDDPAVHELWRRERTTTTRPRLHLGADGLVVLTGYDARGAITANRDGKVPFPQRLPHRGVVQLAGDTLIAWINPPDSPDHRKTDDAKLMAVPITREVRGAPDPAVALFDARDELLAYVETGPRDDHQLRLIHWPTGKQRWTQHTRGHLIGIGSRYVFAWSFFFVDARPRRIMIRRPLEGDRPAEFADLAPPMLYSSGVVDLAADRTVQVIRLGEGDDAKIVAVWVDLAAGTMRAYDVPFPKPDSTWRLSSDSSYYPGVAFILRRGSRTFVQFRLIADASTGDLLAVTDHAIYRVPFMTNQPDNLPQLTWRAYHPDGPDHP